MKYLQNSEKELPAMNIIRMTGGLGNQMFQYALYLKLCSMGREVKFDDITEYERADARLIMLWVFGIDYPKADRNEINEITDGFLKLSHRIRRKLFGRKSLEYHEESCNFDGQILEKERAYLTGYFQSEKYFKDIEDKVRSAFIFSDRMWKGIGRELKGKVEGYLDRIQGSLSVAVHVRRGDYVTGSRIYGGICTESYYSAAVKHMLMYFPGAVFYIFTNDTEWVKEWIPGLRGQINGTDEESFVVVEGTDENTGYLDMFLMSRCRNYILANSSFSWWGAWLNPSPDKKIIAPSRWFNNQNCRDIYTENMIKISPEGELVKDETG